MIYITMPRDHGKSAIRRIKEALEQNDSQGFLIPKSFENALMEHILHNRMCHGYEPFTRWPTAPCEHELHQEWE